MAIEMHNGLPLLISGCVLIIILGFFFYGYKKRAKILIPSLEAATIRRIQFRRAVGALLATALLFAAFFIGVSHAFISQKTGVIAYMCDESRSMGAENEDGIARIERCKSIIQTLDASFPHSIVSIYGFTERASSHSSFSRDHDHFQKTVAYLVAIEAVPGTGSEIGFSVQSVIEDAAHKRNALGKEAAILVLLSDGESTSAEEREDLARAVQYARSNHVRILIIGVGEETPNKIPIYEDGMRVGYEKDVRGKEILTKLDETTLRFLAEGSGGIYVNEREIEKARAFLNGALADEKVETEGAGNKIVVYLVAAALAPFLIFLRYSII